jgi:hypothetical protein
VTDWFATQAWTQQRRNDFAMPPPLAWIDWSKHLANLPTEHKRHLDRRSIGVVASTQITGLQMRALTEILRKAATARVGYLRHLGKEESRIPHNIGKQLGFRILIHPESTQRLDYYTSAFSVLVIKAGAERFKTFITKCDSIILVDKAERLPQKVNYVKQHHSKVILFTVTEDGTTTRV